MTVPSSVQYGPLEQEKDAYDEAKEDSQLDWLLESPLVLNRHLC